MKIKLFKWTDLLDRKIIRHFLKCFLIMFKYFEHENCATNSLRLDLWSTESLIHPNKEYEAPFMGTKGVSNMKVTKKVLMWNFRQYFPGSGNMSLKIRSRGL